MYEATLTTLIVTGLYLILLAFMFNTNGLWTTFLYKFAPFLLGCALLFIAAEQSGTISVAPVAPGVPASTLSSRAGPVACVARLKLPTADGPDTHRCALASLGPVSGVYVPSNTSAAAHTLMSERMRALRA